MRVPFDLDGITVTVSTSIGVAFYQGGPETGPDVLKQADGMLYQAKRAGRNTWRAAELATCIG
jgi:diguanylate cyclase (GGDEF)-like protein